MYNPSPMPSLLLFVYCPNVLYSPPRFSITSSVIPHPVSSTSKQIKFILICGFLKMRIVIPPFFVNLSALLIRLNNIWIILLLSEVIA